MHPISYARHQFPPEIIRHAIWLYLRFTLSYRDVEELLAERGLEVSYETVRGWGLDRQTPGIWTRWWSRSRGAACTCGAPSTARARSWMCLFSRRDKSAAL